MTLFGKIAFYFGLLFLGQLWCQSANTSSETIKKNPRNYTVRVLLQEVLKSEPVEWNISSAKDFIIINLESKTKTKIDKKKLLISTKKNFLVINGIAYNSKQLYIYSDKNLIFEDKEYQGSFLITQDEKKTYLINSLDLEDYVCSVLRTESWPGWPLEVNKAFAIASRSYVIGIILSNRQSKLPYHVKNTNKHQTYSGVHTNQVLKDAVAQTKGIFLAYDNKPIIAMFDSCCGGVIPAHIHGVNFADAPYLARSYACNFCKDCKVYTWSAQFTLDYIEQLVQKEYRQLKKIKQVKVAKTDKAGLVQQVHFKGHNKQFSLTGKKVYSMFSKKIKSFYFDIALQANKIIFTGKGLGHHLGLCQWGAREMVRQGYNYKSILSFYYPETSFMKLQ